MAKGRPRHSGRGSIELATRKRGFPCWRFHWYEYKGDVRVHKCITLGRMDEIPSMEVAEQKAEEWRARIGISAFRYKRKRGKAERARCSDEQYRQMVIDQQGRCAICHGNPIRLCVDHDHDTGKVRGLLCSKCNAAIGLLDDSPAMMRAAAAYVERHSIKESNSERIMNEA